MEKKKIGLGILTAALIFLILFCTTETVMSMGKTDGREMKKYYTSMEKEYLTGVRQMLTEKGYPDSGITIRWTEDEAGRRTYTALIHHRKINTLNDREKEELLKELSTMAFTDADLYFSIT